MSYILEALKKSQQERTLGQVPTLEQLPQVPEPPRKPFSHWGLVAVILAGSALVVALYAVLRVPPVQNPVLDPPGVPVSPVAPEPEARTPKPRPSPEEFPRDRRPIASQAAVDTPSAEEPPMIAEEARPSREPAMEVPADLRAEIEAFKRAVSTGVGETPPAVPPEELRLPMEVQERLPAFLMTVHRYAKAPKERFVLINGRKLGEGDRTRAGILVEEILPNGVVLEYEGYRFFQHR